MATPGMQGKEKTSAPDFNLLHTVAFRMEIAEFIDIATNVLDMDKHFNSMDEEFAKSPLTVIQSAKEGSLSACITLQDASAPGQGLPDSLCPEVLKVFATHIQNSCPPEKADKLAFQLADVCFPGLLMLLEHPTFQEEANLQTLLKAWPSILEWHRCSLIEGIRLEERIDYRAQRKWYETRFLLIAVYKFWNIEDFRSVARGPQLLELVRHAYQHPNPDEGALKTLCRTIFFLHFDEDDLDRLTDLIAAMKDRSEVFLDFLLVLVADEELAHFPLNVLLPCAKAFLAFYALSGPSPTLRERGSIFVEKALGTLISSEPNIEILTAFPLVLSLLSLLSRNPGEPRWPLVALQSRVLELIAVFPHDRYHGLVKIKQDFISLLPTHLIDPCIIYACEKAISTLSEDNRRKLLDGPLGKTWKSFIDQFFEKYLFYCYFEFAGYPRGCYKCGKHVQAGADLRKCMTCKNSEYCSEECQAQDWPSHRKKCKALRDKRYCSFPSYAIDLFRRRLAAYDARCHLPGIRKLASKRFPGFPLRSLCIEVDYAKYPPEISVIPMAELDKLRDIFKEQELTNVPAVLDDIRLHNGSTGVVLIRERANGIPVVRKQDFDWSPPYFSSEHGSRARQNYRGTNLSTLYRDNEGNKLETTWSEVDELAHRGGLKSSMILDGKIGEIKRKVLGVVVRERGRMMRLHS